MFCPEGAILEQGKKEEDKEMRERPLILNGEEVRAVLDGRKTQFRRAIRDRSWAADSWPTDDDNWPMASGGEPEYERVACPYGKQGDRIWVRETWCKWKDPDEFRYFADFSPRYGASERGTISGVERVEKWFSSSRMPRWVSRITLEIVRVRVERVKDISNEDALAEGHTPLLDLNDGKVLLRPTDRFAEQWDFSSHSKNVPYHRNPWVWVIKFKVVKQ